MSGCALVLQQLADFGSARPARCCSACRSRCSSTSRTAGKAAQARQLVVASSNPNFRPTHSASPFGVV